MQTVLVTGGARGIGKCIVENLALKGYHVILNYNKSRKQALQMQEELKEKGINIEIYQADVSKRNEVNNMVDNILKKNDKIDILINNAGIAKLELFTEITEEGWKTMIDTNLSSVFYTTQAVVKSMIREKSGCIINISSIWGITGAACEVAYSTSKAAINGMTKALAKELGPSNIRVNAIAPGVIDTEMNHSLDNAIKEKIKEETPLNKIGNTMDIYRCIKWLIEDEFTTGQIISPNGGFLI